MKRLCMIGKKLLIIAVLFALCINGRSIKAAENEENTNHFVFEQTELNIMFVIDYSNSMNSNDKNKMALQTIGVFIDTAFSEKTNIGYTAYNHGIKKSRKPQSIKTIKTRRQLKSEINGIDRSGSTDIGLAMKHAMSLLGKDKNRKSIMILISDGETDLTNANTGRTEKESDRDLKRVTAECRKSGIPIYTIAYSDAYAGNLKQLKNMSADTKASFYHVPEAKDLIEILNKISRDTTMSSVVPLEEGLKTGTEQELDIELDNSGDMKEADILVVSSSPIKEASLIYKGKGSSSQKSENYFTGKIVNPDQDHVKLKITTQSSGGLKIYIKKYHDLSFHVKVPKTVKKNIPFIIEGYFFNKSENRIVNEKFYKDFVPDITILRNDKSKEHIEVDDTAFKDGSLKTGVKIGASGTYELDYGIKSKWNSLRVQDMILQAENQPPVGNFIKSYTGPETEKMRNFDLKGYFTDQNNDKLAYSVIEAQGDSVALAIEGDTLLVRPDKPGVTSFKLQAVDEEGAVVVSSETVITIKSFWVFYIKEVIVALVFLTLLAALLTFFIIKKHRSKPRPYYCGRLVLEFVNMPIGLSAKIENFSLNPLETEDITLAFFIENAGIRADTLEGDKIHFLPAYNRNIIFHHSTSDSILLENRQVKANQDYTVEYGNKILITSVDGDYVLQIQFLADDEN